MSRSYPTVRRVIFCLIASTLMLSGFPAMAKSQSIGHLSPVGGYSDIYAGFAPTPTSAPTSAATPTPTLTPPAISTAAATPIPTAASFGTSATGDVLPIMPITIGAGVLLFVIVLVAGRRRK